VAAAAGSIQKSSCQQTDTVHGDPRSGRYRTLSPHVKAPMAAAVLELDSITVTRQASCCRTRRTIAWNGVDRMGIHKA
jgi:hypothetical protein